MVRGQELVRSWRGWGQGCFGCLGMVATQMSHLEVSVYQKVGLKVIVVLSERVDELLGYLKGGGRRSPENPCPPHPRRPSLGPHPP